MTVPGVSPLCGRADHVAATLDSANHGDEDVQCEEEAGGAEEARLDCAMGTGERDGARYYSIQATPLEAWENKFEIDCLNLIQE